MRLWHLQIAVIATAALLCWGTTLLAPSKRTAAWDVCKNPRNSIDVEICAESR